MKFLELYSLTLGHKIKNTNLLNKFFPLPFNKYIVFHPVSKSAKFYSRWEDVLDIIYPILKENNTHIIQTGAKGEPAFKYCYHVQGQTSFNQVSFLIKNSLLYLGADTFSSHLAGIHNVPLVTLVSNNYSSVVRPFFGDQSKQIILEPDRAKKKPSFQLDEGARKQIDEIKPEDIAAAVCKLLNLHLDYPLKSVFFGESYHTKIIESTVNTICDPRGLGVDSLILRLDYEFNENNNENNMWQQLHVCPCTIVTDKPISIDKLKQYKSRIKQLVYVVKDNHDPGFATLAQRTGIPLVLTSYMPEEKLNPIKLEYMDIGTIFRKIIRKPGEIKELEGKDLSKLRYKTGKFTLSAGKLYPSKAALMSDKPIPNFDNQINPIIDTEDFWKELEFFYLLTED